MTANDQPPLFQRQDDDKTHIHRVRATAATNQPPLFQHDDHDMRGAAERARTIGRDWQSFPVPRDRPTGVAILALFIGGLNALLGCLVVFALSALGVYAILLLLLFALNVWVSVGLWRMRRWARTAAIVLYAVNAAFALVSAFANGLTLEGVITFVVSLVIIYYLTRAYVAEAFQ